MTQLKPGQTAFRDFGPLRIRIDRHHEGVAITVAHHPLLDRPFTNLGLARTYLRLLRDMAYAGRPVCEIEDAAGVWSTAAAVVDEMEGVAA